MNRTAKPVAERVFCEICAKVLPRTGALMAEGIDDVAYFCSSTCYDRWLGDRAPAPPPHEVQGARGRSKSLDERMKRLVKRHPQRDEPRVNSVEVDDLPPT